MVNRLNDPSKIAYYCCSCTKYTIFILFSVSQRRGASNENPGQYFYAIGYPSGYPFYRNRQIECDASYATSDNPDGFIGLFGPYDMGIGCDMNHGSFGGPWLTHLGTSSLYINGHNAYKYDSSQPLAMYSPYYGNEELDLYNHAQNA